jgi:hypothetical protein
MQYVALNPIEASLCESPADWPYSSFRATAGMVLPPPFLDVSLVRGLFSGVPGVGGAAFADFVNSGLTELVH